MMRFQQTLKKEIYFSGIGIHTGENVNLVVKPAKEDSGIVFKVNNSKIKANVKNISPAHFNTILEKGNIKIYTVEHLLATFYALSIDNVEVWTDKNEIPILDGSSKIFTEEILKCGVVPQKRKKRTIILKRPTFVHNDNKIIIALPSNTLKITYFLDHPNKLIGRSIISFDITPSVFVKEISPARTFATLDEAMKIKKIGLARGGTKDNTIVVSEDKVLTRLRFKDEFVRHKVLDILGDISLLGYHLNAHIIGIRTGHFQNHLLLKEISKKSIVDIS